MTVKPPPPAAVGASVSALAVTAANESVVEPIMETVASQNPCKMHDRINGPGPQPQGSVHNSGVEGVGDLSDDFAERLASDPVYEVKPPEDHGRSENGSYRTKSLLPRVGFDVSNMQMEPDWINRFYNQRCTAEQHIKEGN